MKIIECQQGSAEWLSARSGVVTASEFDNLISPLKKPRDGQTRQTYLFKKVAEKILGRPQLSGSSFAMDQGKLKEDIAIPFYEFARNVSTTRVGFCVSDCGRFGCSPDSLVGADGGLEAKSPEEGTHIGYLVNGVVPQAYLAQVHGCLWVTGRHWWDFLSFSRYLPPLLIRVERDPSWDAALSEAVSVFVKDMDKALAIVQEKLGAQKAA